LAARECRSDFDLNRLAIHDRRGEPQVKPVANAQGAWLERRVERAAFEANGLNRHR